MASIIPLPDGDPVDETPATTWCRACDGTGEFDDGQETMTCGVCGGVGEHPADLAYGVVGGGRPPVHYPDNEPLREAVRRLDDEQARWKLDRQAKVLSVLDVSFLLERLLAARWAAFAAVNRRSRRFWHRRHPSAGSRPGKAAPRLRRAR